MFDDVLNQPADVAFVSDELLRADHTCGRVDPERIGVGGFSLGAVTALAAGFNTDHRDPRVRAVVSLAGCFWTAFGGNYEVGNIPLLLVHGTQDSTVPYAASEKVYRVAGPPKVFVTLAEGHEAFEDVPGHSEAVVQTTVAFWRLYLQNERGSETRLLEPLPGTSVRSEGVHLSRA